MVTLATPPMLLQFPSQFPICPQEPKFQLQVLTPTMRFAFLLLVAAVSLIASGDALSTQADATSRHLRSHHKTNAYDAEEEERGLDKSIVKSLPEQFQNMYRYPSNMENVLESWRTGLQSVDDAVMYMKSLGMDFDAIKHFVDAYRNHINKKGLPY